MTTRATPHHLTLAALAALAGATLMLAGDLTIEGNLRVEGALDAASNRVVNVAAPAAPNDAATKAYVDTAVLSHTNTLTLADLLAVLTNVPPRGGISMGSYTNR